MSGGIYLVQGERLVEMTEQGYASKSLLQDLLARHPHILAGDLMASTPRRWLLISREVSLASEEDGAGDGRSTTSSSIKTRYPLS